MNTPVTREPDTTRADLLRDPALDSGRLWVLALMGLIAGALPLPAIPTALLRRVRGAVVHEVSARHGLCPTADARAWMSDPSKTVRRGAFVATAAFVAKRAMRRLGALGVLPPAIAWVEIYALGLLFERYVVVLRQSQTVRIDLDEARMLRTAIDRATGGVLSPDLRTAPANHRGAIEDLRDFPTRVSDGILIGLASGPSYLRRRLEASFDQAVRETSLASEGQRGPANA